VVVETSEISVSEVTTVIDGIVRPGALQRLLEIVVGDRERELAADRSPPASSPTRIRSVTWRSLRISR
jgi:hypothetical protein